MMARGQSRSFVRYFPFLVVGSYLFHSDALLVNPWHDGNIGVQTDKVLILKALGERAG